ncbi:MAG: 16S rRNA (cytosine(1402)-N(4))-methyltransferase RsmH [Bacteroidetes bacterium]|nr:16S rRNA (cytosine(1402)-N(4))-methyltransferase RsmH [Bacteroidota bacterium]
MSATVYHTAVLLNETVDALCMKPDGVYVDATFGGGGHSREMLKRLGANGRLLAFDQDPDARQNLPEDERLTFIASNFRHLDSYLNVYKAERVDGILADLGVSSHQLDAAERGFTHRVESPLDMRMGPNVPFTAAQVLNTASQEELTRIFKEYGEVKLAYRLAQRIVERRAEFPFERSIDLRPMLKGLCPPDGELRLAAQVFQALRIHVNDELSALRDFLQSAALSLKQGGRVAVISYHSLEDRLVKHFFRSGNFSDEASTDLFGKPLRPLNPINRQAIVPNSEELAENPRSRSAKLRIAQKA